MTRYDMKKFVDVSVGHYSTTMQSHIYKTLTDLEQEGWVGKKSIEQEGKPNRKKYSIIKTGRAELRRGMTALDPRIKTAEYLGGAKRGTTTSLSARRLGWANFLVWHKWWTSTCSGRAALAVTALPYWLYRDRSAMSLPEANEGDRERR